MPKWLSAALIIAAAVLLTAGLIFYAVGRRHFWRDVMVADIEVMSTVAEITLPAGKNPGDDILAAAEELAAVQDYCNIFDEESELAALNRSAHEQPFTCSEELYAVLTEARKAYMISEGRFDISCLPLMRVWGFHSDDDEEELTRPDSEELAAALAVTGLDKAVFDDAARTVYFPVEGMCLDLGGIAKGYAVDRAVDALVARKCRAGVVNLGGNLRVLPDGLRRGGKYGIGIKNPLNPASVCYSINIKGGYAVATSGSYERFVEIDGVYYSHIIDPASGEPAVSNVLSATVVAPTAVQADWLSTAVFIGGEEFARRMVKKYPDIRIILCVAADNDAGFTIVDLPDKN